MHVPCIVPVSPRYIYIQPKTNREPEAISIIKGKEEEGLVEDKQKTSNKKAQIVQIKGKSVLFFENEKSDTTFTIMEQFNKEKDDLPKSSCALV